MSQKVSTSRIIKSNPKKIFELLTNPEKHPLFDGSGSVVKFTSEPETLKLGSKFSMDVKMGVKYPVTNKVVEFEENKLIAWQHIGKHIWKYDLHDNGDGTTTVTETWDWSVCPFAERKGLEIAGFPKRNLKNMEKTLEKLARLVEQGD